MSSRLLDAKDLVRKCEEFGFFLERRGTRIKVLGKRALPEALQVELKGYKSELLGMLSEKKDRRKPFLDGKEALVIPFDSEVKYHWWKGGQSIAKTLLEIMVSDDV